MLPFRSKLIRFSKQKVSLLTLIGICALTFPIPLLETPNKDSLQKEQTTPFPCQHKACGCRTAEQCWTTCCCNSPAQRAAWAKHNNVTPPSYAILEMSKGGISDSKARSCCSHRKNTSPTENQSQAKLPVKERKVKRGFVIGALALQCHGQASDFSSMPWGVVPDEQFESFAIPLLGLLDAPTSPSVLAVYLDPEKPPPRA
jgi:hypothetical protein